MNEKKKIVFVSRLYLPHLGGVEIHLKEISAILLKMGHEVCIVTRKHDKKLADYLEYDGVKVYRIAFDSKDNKSKTWQEIKKLEPIFEQADIVHIHDVFWWILPIYKLIRKKLFLTFHGWETEFPIPINSKIHRLIASKLSLGTIHVGDYIQKFYWDKPNIVTYGGINPKRFTKSNTLQSELNQTKKSNVNVPKKFVFIGRLEKDTDLNLYFKFLESFKNKKINFEITWVGDGTFRKKCEKYGKVTGFVKNVSQYIVAADFVFASSYLSILEAQMLEKVVLSFYSNPLKKLYLELFPGSKFMLISDNVNGMLSKLEHLFSSRKLLPKCEKDAKKFAQKQTWENVVKDYLKLWNSKMIVSKKGFLK